MAMFSKSLFTNIRFYILVFSFLLSIGLYLWTKYIYLDSSVQIARLIQIYALSAVSYLYTAILATPLTRNFPSFPFRGYYIKARRAIGVSAFYFATLHALLAFFIQLGGFDGLPYLGGKYLLAISLSFTALVILFLMASTSFDVMIEKLTFKRWKILHRFVYLAGILILTHALLLGSHFVDLSGTIPQIFTVALSILLILEAKRFDQYLQSKSLLFPTFGISSLVILSATFVYLIFSFLPEESTPLSFGIHSQHIQIAKDLQQQANAVINPNLPSFLQGDRNLRFSASYNQLKDIEPRAEVELNFKIYNASSGFPVQLFSTTYEKPMHLIIVDEDLAYFEHIHPTQTNDGFTIKTTFPHWGRFHIYLDFQPLGAVEQQFAFIQDIGNPDLEGPHIHNDTTRDKVFGNYRVIVDYPSPLKASEMTVGNQKFKFTILDAKTGQPITNLKPYLASFGHLVMINHLTYDYIHIHPDNLVAPQVNSTSGPDVSFTPIGIYGPIKPGIYRIFGQFNPNNQLFTADYTIKIE